MKAAESVFQGTRAACRDIQARLPSGSSIQPPDGCQSPSLHPWPPGLFSCLRSATGGSGGAQGESSGGHSVSLVLHPQGEEKRKPPSTARDRVQGMGGAWHGPPAVQSSLEGPGGPWALLCLSWPWCSCAKCPPGSPLQPLLWLTQSIPAFGMGTAAAKIWDGDLQLHCNTDHRGSHGRAQPLLCLRSGRENSQGGEGLACMRICICKFFKRKNKLPLLTQTSACPRMDLRV